MDPATARPASRPVSSAGRLVGVLTNPVATFRAIAERPTWAAPLVVLLLSIAASSAVLAPKVDQQAFADQMREQMESQGQQMPEEQLDTMAKFGVGAIFGCSILLTLAIGFAAPAVIMLICNLFFGGRINYRTSLAVALHGLMPFALLNLLYVPVALGRESISPEELQMRSLLPSSLAVFAPEEAGPTLVTLLASVDLFALWTIVLLVLGYHVAARVSKGSAAVAVVVPWALFTLAMAGLASLGGPR
jgi:hypothetical protein